MELVMARTEPSCVHRLRVILVMSLRFRAPAFLARLSRQFAGLDSTLDDLPRSTDPIRVCCASPLFGVCTPPQANLLWIFPSIYLRGLPRRSWMACTLFAN